MNSTRSGWAAASTSARCSGVRARARILRLVRVWPVNELDLAWYLRGVGDLRASFDLLSKVLADLVGGGPLPPGIPAWGHARQRSAGSTRR